MSTKIKFGNKIIQLPGSYSRIISGQTNPPRDLDYGKLLIIDAEKNGSLSGQSIVGGAGVNGTLSSGINSVYRFTDINSFKDFVTRGWWWKAADYLFNPDGNGQGVSEILVVKPTTTTPSILNFTTIDGAGGNSGGVLSILTKDEGAGSVGSTGEVRARSKVTVTTATAPVAGDKIRIGVLGNSIDNCVILAEYTVKLNDTIALIITGLVNSANKIGISSVHVSDLVSLTLRAPVGLGSSINGTAPVISITGTSIASTPVNFSGGSDAVNCYSGYSYTIESGVIDSSKFIFKFWKGTFRGLYSDGWAYDMNNQGVLVPELVAQTPEVSSISEIITWGNSDYNFGTKFVIDTENCITAPGIGAPDGEILDIDVANYPSYVPAYGGTEVFNSIDDTLEVIKELNYNYVITTTDLKDCYADTNILKILNHIKLDAKYDKFMILPVPVANSISETVILANSFDSEKVNLVFDSILEKSRWFASGFREWDSFFHCCLYIGRILGLAPEIPVTFKSMNIDGIKTPLTSKQKEILDEAGVLVTIYDDDFKKFISLHDVNTLQDNDFVLNNQGKSHLIQIERIKCQLNKELIINSKLDLLSNPEGVNRNSLSKTDAIEWTKGYLQRKLGTLIVEYRNVTATVQEDVIFVDYEASPNTEIKSIFFTGRLYL